MVLHTMHARRGWARVGYERMKTWGLGGQNAHAQQGSCTVKAMSMARVAATAMVL